MAPVLGPRPEKRESVCKDTNQKAAPKTTPKNTKKNVLLAWRWAAWMLRQGDRASVAAAGVCCAKNFLRNVFVAGHLCWIGTTLTAIILALALRLRFAWFAVAFAAKAPSVVETGRGTAPACSVEHVCVACAHRASLRSNERGRSAKAL